jgi:hypothetical protein
VGTRKWLVLGIREIELFHILLSVMNSRSKMAMERVWVSRVFTVTTFLTNTCNLEFVAFQTLPTSHWRMRHRSSIMVSFVACVACSCCLCTRECAVGIRKLLPILSLKTRFHIQYGFVSLLICDQAVCSLTDPDPLQHLHRRLQKP